MCVVVFRNPSEGNTYVVVFYLHYNALCALSKLIFMKHTEK